GTYNWFFPTGTTAVLSGRWNDQARLQLSRGAVAWVSAADAVPLAAGTPPPGGAVGSVRLQAGPTSVTLRVPLPGKLPFLVTEQERSLALRIYGAASNINWMQYGRTDPLVTRMTYAQPAADEVTITLELSRRVWGYRTRFEGRDLLVEVRRPPPIDARHPLRGRTIVLDPGHPPLGAKGPTGLWEPVATLAVAHKAKQLLERAGATVLLTRTGPAPVDLFPRTHFAELHDADVLVSIHANALPDGMNPFVNNGTSVYYFQPRSAALARELDRALVAELGVRDLGMGRGDYALVRPTWMPSALTEALFIIIPEQEALLASDCGMSRMRNAEFGMRNVRVGVLGRTTLPCNCAFRNPHSAFFFHSAFRISHSAFSFWSCSPGAPFPKSIRPGAGAPCTPRISGSTSDRSIASWRCSKPARRSAHTGSSPPSSTRRARSWT
ncbi:MAG: hypothetical protein DMD36_06500, partial [Gemmatimonadetes bacterium]